MIVGPSGTGKSLLCQILAEQFQKTFQVALLASTHLDTRRSLLQAILYELNRPYRGMDEGELRLSLVDYITLNDDCSRGVVLLVDEAHHLPLRLLDEIRSLTNLTRDMQPAVRMVLAGSHVLEERFASPKLESFSQRISARCYLEAFQRSETQAYIQGRISACGGRGGEIFPAETCQMVHKATDGVPRLINQVCDHVMLLAYAAGIRRIEPAHVEEAWADLQQLPTPWNAPAAPSGGDSVIEFGGLDDGPLELPPIAGKIAAAEATGEPRRKRPRTRYRKRQRHAAHAGCRDGGRPGDVRTTSPHPEVAGRRAGRIPAGGDERTGGGVGVRNAASVCGDLRGRRSDCRSLCRGGPAGVPSVPAAEPAATVAAVATAATAAVVDAGKAASEEPRECATTRPQPGRPHGRATAAAESEVAAARGREDRIAEGRHRRRPNALASVPPPRQEFGRLFAKLRRRL